MRFIFDYVTCCMMSSPCNDNEAPSSHPPSSRATEDETRSLVKTSTTTMSGRRRKRTSTRGSSVDWQPSLFVIAEDNAVAATPGKTVEKVHRSTVATTKQPSSSQRNVKRCVASSGRVGSSSRSYDFSRDPIPMVVPTFSAAPFMF